MWQTGRESETGWSTGTVPAQPSWTRERERWTGPLSAWLETFVQLPVGLSAESGPLRLWPFQRDMADAMTDPAIERVTLLKPTRVGFTSLLTGVLAYYIDNEPCPILVIQPTDSDARDYMVSDVEPVFDASPKLKGVLPLPNRAPGDRSRLTHRIMKNGASLKIVSAKAPRNFRRHTARVLLCDEIDAYFTSAEGSPLLLAERRTLSFANRKIICGSTPLFEETSHATRLYAQSDQRVYECPCPKCGAFTEILWSHIEWPDNEPERAAFRCPHCRSLIDEQHKPAMVNRGHWRITAPKVRGHAGFRLNALVSLLPNASWAKLASEFILAKSNPDSLRVFVNTTLAQAWKSDTGSDIDELALMKRAERFDLSSVPTEVVAVTAGVDVQDDRFECCVVGWTGTNDALVLGHEVIHGPVVSESTWLELDEFLKSRFPHPSGGALKIEATVIDAADGGHMDKALQFCTVRTSRKILAGKGQAGLHRPSIVRSTSRYVKNKRSLWLVGVDTIKSQIYAKLSRGNTIRFSDTLGLDWVMAKNFVAPGEVVTVTSPGIVGSGAGVMVGAMFGIATHAAGTGDPLELALTGVWTLPKAAGAISAGALVYWSGTQVTTVNTNALIGVAVAASSGSTVKVRLNGSFGDPSAAELADHETRIAALEA